MNAYLLQDYQAEMEAFQRRTEQQHIVDWVEREVVKSISPQLVCTMCREWKAIKCRSLTADK